MIKFKEVHTELHQAELLLVHTSINKILQEYNEAVSLTQKRLRVRKLDQIEKKDIQMNSVNMFSGGETSISCFRGQYVKSEASLGLIAIEKTKRWGLCAKIHIIRTEKARNVSNETFRYNLESGFYNNYDGLNKLYNGDKTKIAHHIIFQHRIDKYQKSVQILLKKRVEKAGVKNVNLNHEFTGVHVNIGRLTLHFDYNNKTFSIYLTRNFIVIKRFEHKGFPTSAVIKKELFKLIGEFTQSKQDPDDIIDMLLFKDELLEFKHAMSI